MKQHRYAREEGFSVMTRSSIGVTTRSSDMGEDSKLKYITLAFARSEKTLSSAKNFLKPQPSTKIDCRAQVNHQHV